MCVDSLMRILPSIHSDNASMLKVYMTESIRMSDMNFLRHQINPGLTLDVRSRSLHCKNTNISMAVDP